MLDHVTVHIPEGSLDGDDLPAFMALIGFREIPARDTLYEHDLKVRWFVPVHVGVEPVKLHFVETDNGEHDILAYGHFCVKMPKDRIRALSSHRLCTRDSGSGRIWMEYANIRVEVRP